MNIFDMAKIAKQIKCETKYTPIITTGLQCVGDGVEYSLTIGLFDKATNEIYCQGYANRLQSVNFAGLSYAVVDMRQCGENKGEPVCADVLARVRLIMSRVERNAMGW
jgi:hypothetical protein